MNNNKELLQQDYNALTCLSWLNEKADETTVSLALSVKGTNGSAITWKSSNTKIITNFGRVIRPKRHESPAPVIMTAELKLGAESMRKSFPITVVPDEAFADPEYESDKDFFGKLDYTIEELSAVKSAVINGDYKRAKEELLLYFKKRAKPDIVFERKGYPLIKMLTNGIQTFQRSDRVYKGEFAVSSAAYERKEIKIREAGLTNGMTVTYDVCAKYNEMPGFYIAGKDYPDPEMRPRLIVFTAPNSKHEFQCEDSVTLRAEGDFSADENEMYIKTFGNFWGEDTFHSLFKFHLDGLEGADITEATLVLYAKKDSELMGDKEAYVLLFSENIWGSKTAKWEDFNWQFANRNGLYDETWDYMPGFDFEYFFQRLRFLYFPWAAAEYEQTGDKEILYSLLMTMTDFIKKQGHPRTYTQNGSIGRAWCDETVSRTLCGGWPRGLDAATRLRSFSSVFDVLMKSEYATADDCCAILKYFRDAIDGLLYQSITSPFANMRVFEMIAAFSSLLLFPEFCDYNRWIKDSIEIMENIIFTVTMEDGAYRETVASYAHAVCKDFVEFNMICMRRGVVLPKEFDERLKKFVLYYLLTQGPDRESLLYGDQRANKAILIPDLLNCCEDSELMYIMTRGEKGEKPRWTSYCFKEGLSAMLRSDWSKEAVYLFIQARGAGSHGHQDANSITLIANRRVLLTDAGPFTYIADDPYRLWGQSTKAHNTVEINDIPQQRYGSETGKLYAFETNPAADMISFGSNHYPDFEFIRTVEFIKPNIIKVSDELIPKDMKAKNTYRQLWHMYPTANAVFDFENKKMHSSYEFGSNLEVVSLDSDTMLKSMKGWYDYGYQQITVNHYGYFEKKDVVGVTTFNTLLKIY